MVKFETWLDNEEWKRKLVKHPVRRLVKLFVKHGVLFKAGRPVAATSMDAGLSKFLNWLTPKKTCLL